MRRSPADGNAEAETRLPLRAAGHNDILKVISLKTWGAT